MRVEIDVGAAQVLPLAETGERRRKNTMTAASQAIANRPPAPTSVPSAVNEDK